MLQLDPGRTAYDFHFRLAGVPVRVHPLFWFVTFILGFDVDPKQVLIWIGASFVSILVHEFGHAFAMQRYGFTPRIVLYSLGGLAIAEEARSRFDWGNERRRDRKSEIESIVIALAGPFAGFLLAGLVIVALVSSGGRFEWHTPEPESLLFWRFGVPEGTSGAMIILIHDMLQINIFWGIVNLLPVLPLDGGQVARGLLERAYGARHGLMLALKVSVAAGIAVGLIGYFGMRDGYTGIMFFLLAISNYQTLRQLESTW